MKKLLCALGAVCALLPSVVVAGEKDVRYQYYLDVARVLSLEDVYRQKNGLLYAVMKEEDINVFSDYPFEKLYYHIANINCRDGSGLIYKMHGSLNGRTVNTEPMKVFWFNRPKDKYDQLLYDLCK